MKIDPVDKADVEEIADIYETYLNSGDAIRKHIHENMNMKDYVGFKATDQGRIIGIMSGRPGIDFTYPHPELEAHIQKLFPGERIFSNESILVLPEYRNQGITHELGRRMVHEVCRKGYHLLLAELWIYPDGSVPAAETTEHWGEIVYEERKNRFYEKLEQYGMLCPVCGKDCVCGALIRLFRLHGENEEGENVRFQA